MRIALLVLLLAGGTSPGGTASPQIPETSPDVGVEILLGAPINVPTQLRISQSGHADIAFTARYETRPLESPLYYALRISYGHAGRCWAIELLHHKLHLDNSPPEVQSFSITHGLNLVTLQRRWDFRGNLLSAAVGMVIAHPESRVRGERFSEDGGLGGRGYFLTGPCIGLAAGREVRLTGRLALAVEIRGTLSRAKVPIADGDAVLTHLAAHALAGLALRL